jgi:quercetin dioxygenase-like cupin family protein
VSFFLGSNCDKFDCTDRGAIYMEPKEPNSMKAQATNLVNLIDYQEGSVVSRTLIDKKVGTLTLFAFDEGQGLSEHTAPFDAFVYILDGEAEVVISGKAHSVGTGAMIIMPANEPHSLKALEKFKMMLVMIRA